MWSISSTWEQIYVAGKKWDLAREVFNAAEGGNRIGQRQQPAKQQLDDLETLQKYGLRPQRVGESGGNGGRGRTLPRQRAGAPAAAGGPAQDEDEEADAPPKPAPVKPGDNWVGAISEG